MSGFEEVDAVNWEEWATANDAVLLDVREPKEWELGTLPGALRISVGQIVEQQQTLDPARATLVICRSGARSARVASYLTANGFSTVANMVGGMKALGMQS